MGFLWKSLRRRKHWSRSYSREKIPCKQRLNQHRNNIETTSKQQLKDNETVEDIKKKAMESLRETKKRNSYEGGASLERRKSRRAEPLVDFLREKAAADREIRQQELRAKQQEQESQQQMMKATILQQQQMNTAFLTVVHKLLDK